MAESCFEFEDEMEKFLTLLSVIAQNKGMEQTQVTAETIGELIYDDDLVEKAEKRAEQDSDAPLVRGAIHQYCVRAQAILDSMDGLLGLPLEPLLSPYFIASGVIGMYALENVPIRQAIWKVIQAFDLEMDENTKAIFNVNTALVPV